METREEDTCTTQTNERTKENTQGEKKFACPQRTEAVYLRMLDSKLETLRNAPSTWQIQSTFC